MRAGCLLVSHSWVAPLVGWFIFHLPKVFSASGKCWTEALVGLESM